MHSNLIAEAILEVIPYETCAKLTGFEVQSTLNIQHIYLRPTETELGIYRFYSVGDEMYIQWESAEYSNDHTLREFLNIEVGHTVWATSKLEESMEVFMFNENNCRNVPVITISQLEAAYERAVKAHELFAQFGLIEEKKHA